MSKILLLFLFLVGINQVKSQRKQNISTLLDKLVEGYDSRIRPNYGGPPVEVGVTLHGLNIQASNTLQEFSLDMCFRQFWNDPRLSYSNSIDSIDIPASMAHKFWTPDTFFVNERSAYFHKVTSYNAFSRILPNGDVIKSIRLSLTASCPMDFTHFPMDSQKCKLYIESYGFTAQHIVYSWKLGNHSVSFTKVKDMPTSQFKFAGHVLKNKTLVLSSGSYSRLAVKTFFERCPGYYFTHVYLPAIFTVMASWISFWIGSESTSARVLLNTIALVAVALLMGGSSSGVPDVSQITALDVYTIFCLVMVFLSLLEFVVVVRLINRAERFRNRADSEEKSDAAKKRILSPDFVVLNENITPHILEKYSRFLFPIIFACFNIFYWSIYSGLTSLKIDGIIRSQ